MGAKSSLLGIECLSMTGAVASGGPASWDQVVAQGAGAPDHTIAYGQDTDQIGELRLPDQPGPHPVVVLIHGGCWLPEFDRMHIRPLAEAVTAMGLATWTIEYRRPDEAEDGWPATFEDAASALDILRTLAGPHYLDMGQITVMGHSAGGQLALWLAARTSFNASHRLFSSNPLSVQRVVALAPIADMEAYADQEGSCPDGARRVMGGDAQRHPDRYRAVSPLHNLVIGIPVDIVHAVEDSIVPIDQSETYVNRVVEEGGQAALHRLPPPARHFDVLLTEGAVWELLQLLID
jgi:acetyl esterase/lipase